MAKPSEPDSAPPPAETMVREVRYSLPELLAELRLERTSGTFSQEKLHQVEIGKLFQNRRKRRGQTSS